MTYRSAGLIIAFIAGSALGENASRVSLDVRWRDLPYTDTVFTSPEYRSLAEWEQRRVWLSDQVRFAAGLVPEPAKTPLNARIFGKLVRDGYSIEKVYFESFPGFYVTGNLYRPLKLEGRLPAVACPHGHWKEGRLAHEERGSVPARCITLARLGAVVFSYDMVGYNDSGRQFDHRDPAFATAESALWGISQLHLQTWNSVRVLDFLQSLPEVDPACIGVTGASGGGTQTFLLAAVDDRVKVACPVNMISSTMQGGCICENAPLLRIDTNNMEIAALFAPKPMLMVSATGDWTKLTPQVEYPFVRGIYSLYGQPDRVTNVHVDAPHNYNLASREAMYRFMGRWLLKRPDADSLKEGDIKIEKAEDLLVFGSGELPPNMLRKEEIQQRLKTEFRKDLDAFRPTSATSLGNLINLVRTGLAHSIGSDWPDPGAVRSQWLESPTQAKGLTRAGRFVRVSYRVADVQKDAWFGLRLIITPGGLDWSQGSAGLIGSHNRAVLAEPFGVGEAKRSLPTSMPKNLEQFFTTFNRTDAAEAVYDVLTVLVAELSGDYRLPASMVGVGSMGPICLAARAMVPSVVARTSRLRTVIDMNGMAMDDDQACVKQLFLPGFQRIGGLRAVAAVAAAGGPLWLHNVGDRFDAGWIKAAAELAGQELKITPEPADPQAIAQWLESE